MKSLKVAVMYGQTTVCFIFWFACLMKFVYSCNFEDEYCALRCNVTPSKVNETKMTITWHKRLSYNASERISVETDNRIIINENLLEFWPLSLNDSSEYICTVQGKDYTVKTLSVKKKNPNYCRDELSANNLTKPQGTTAFIKYNLPENYKSDSYSVSWYKDCNLYAENISIISFENLNVSDSAVYTYVITRVHNGKYYNISGKTKLIVTRTIDDVQENVTPAIKGLGKPIDTKIKMDIQENLRPRIIGLGKPIIKEVEMGQSVTVMCNASVGKTAMYEFYWIHNKSLGLDDIIDYCGSNKTIPCATPPYPTQKEGVVYIELKIPHINEDDITYPYVCTLTSSQIKDEHIYRFKLKDKSRDIPKCVFTTSVIAAVTCSVAILFIFITCILFRIEIILLYRHITGLDETTGDSKEYDAYISFESYSSLKGEEREFALNTLAPVLENHFGFKLCIFERDVTPGGAMVDDMNTFLEKSRRLIVVFSKNYTSDKVMYELESGLHKAMVERKIKVIIIEFTPLSELNFLPESLQLLQTTNKVKWKGEKSRPLNSRFWKKIQYLMPAKPVLSQSDFH